MSHETLIDVATLRTMLARSDVRVVDCRFDLGQPDAGRGLYTGGHIPGALYAHLDQDLSAPRTPWSGRHPLPDPMALAETLGRFGIDSNVQVVAYDDSSGAYAARLWWLLRWLGHRKVAVLDGGLAAWRAAGLPLTQPPATVSARRFEPHPDDALHVDADELALLLKREACLLVDARSPERFEGKVEPLDPRAGHVPGAHNRHFVRNLGADGHFLPPEVLASELRQLLGERRPSDLIAMCGSGVTACHTLLALEIAGLRGGRLYPGSFSEWSRDAGRTVATGP
jgi:thiosulfate/3-mercaptopyruvate sulfurtransferase